MWYVLVQPFAPASLLNVELSDVCLITPLSPFAFLLSTCLPILVRLSRTRMSESDTAPGNAGIANIDFTSTHPATGKRIKNIEGWLPEVRLCLSLQLSFCFLLLALLGKIS
jgi:hypothetical protein